MCVTLELYSVDRENLTMAEAIQLWLREGYTFDQCLEYFKKYNRRQPPSSRLADAVWLAELKAKLLTARVSVRVR